MTPAESCALRLLRLCATPSDTYQLRDFGHVDALGNRYEDLFKSLQRQGIVKLQEYKDRRVVRIL